MADLSALRNRSKATRELQEQKVKRAKEAVLDVINSSSFSLTALNHSESEVDEELDAFANKVASRVAETVTDPKIEFMDACNARGLKPSQIRHAVTMVNSTFGLTDETDYEVQLQAVAIYMQSNPNLWDVLGVLQH